MKRIIILFLFLWLPIGVQAQLFPNLGGQRVGTSAAQFLKIGIGARALGMGEAYIAVANDAEALYWNPAGISQFTKNSAFFSHTQWLVDIQLEYAGLVYHLDGSNSLGLAVTYLHTNEMMETTELQPFGTGRYFDFGDFLFGLTYARNMTDKFSFGISVKYLHEIIAELTMQGILFDLGTYYRTGFQSIRFAVSVTNFGRDLAPTGEFTYKNLDNKTVKVNSYQSFSPPTIFRIGIAGEVIDREDHRVTTSVQLNHPNDNKENINIGVEYWWKERLALRAGYKTARVEENFSVGLGLHLPISFADFLLNYAYTNFGRLGYVNRFSIHFQF